MVTALSLLPSLAPLSSPRVRPRSSTVAAFYFSSSSPWAAQSPTSLLPHMPAAAPSPPKKKVVLVPVGLGTEEMEAVVLVDVLRRAGADVLVASVEKGLEIECSSGTRLLADTYVAACADQSFDLVALPGGMPGSARLRDCEVLREIVRRQADGKLLYGAICAAPAVVLEPWGLTRRKQMTCHPAFIHKIPTFRAVKSNVQVSGQLTTSRGPGTAFEFALVFVQQLFGDGLAQEIKEKLLVQTDVTRNEEVNKTEWSFTRVPRVLLPIANGSEEMEVVTMVDILRRAKVDVVVASVEKTLQIIACQNTKIVADLYIDTVREAKFDLIVLPGGFGAAERFHKSSVLKKLLKEQKAEGRAYGATCSSPIILQKLGLLGNKKVTGHPAIMHKLKCVVAGHNGVVIDGKIVTGKGLSSIMDFALAIVSKLLGHARARSVAEGLVFQYQAGTN